MSAAEEAWKVSTPEQRLDALYDAGFVPSTCLHLAGKTWTSLPVIVRAQLELLHTKPHSNAS